jgi:hypothetical protein
LSLLIAYFGQQNIWDVQRWQSPVPNLTFRDAASIYIGTHLAAAGVPENMAQEIQNDYAFLNSRFPGAVMSSTYTSLPVLNVNNVDIGYSLVNAGRVH